ncbi:type I phosphomannose isomerase catalytic subunit [Bryobacter aggregatus]|uniref:type I phosphomannose isomerase catalytic subunit n=1 Tax=Bryobacter aggregatus TaxID=360054 RepID=UPI000568FEF0|nr:type I phosphomannose isomerase catalytic subunit [Bryobacter aggregatus]
MIIGPGARRLKATQYEKIWGTTDLSPIFSSAGKKIGEVWFEDEERLPLLFKFLFTSERLSIQVHPDDEYGAKHENSLGKTEMWHVLRADPQGEIGLGFNKSYTAAEVEAGARNGAIEDMMAWRHVQAGETYFVPAGEVHAIGGGVAICEIQQNSDVTYRLYDYGRPRELHLEHGMAVSRLGPYDGLQSGVVECPYFRTEKLRLDAALSLSGPNTVVIFLEGKGKIAGEAYERGEAWRLLRNVTIEPAKLTTLLYVTWPG